MLFPWISYHVSGTKDLEDLFYWQCYNYAMPTHYTVLLLNPRTRFFALNKQCVTAIHKSVQCFGRRNNSLNHGILVAELWELSETENILSGDFNAAFRLNSGTILPPKILVYSRNSHHALQKKKYSKTSCCLGFYRLLSIFYLLQFKFSVWYWFSNRAIAGQWSVTWTGERTTRRLEESGQHVCLSIFNTS